MPTGPPLASPGRAAIRGTPWNPRVKRSVACARGLGLTLQRPGPDTTALGDSQSIGRSGPKVRSFASSWSAEIDPYAQKAPRHSPHVRVWNPPSRTDKLPRSVRLSGRCYRAKSRESRTHHSGNAALVQGPSPTQPGTGTRGGARSEGKSYP